MGSATGQPIDQPLTGHTGWVRAVCPVPLPDGRILLASGGEDYAVLIWIGHDVKRGQLHTDGGSEDTAGLFRAACVRLPITESMGRAGSALDNAVIESWHSTLEFEWRSPEEFATKAAARQRVAAWVDEYHRTRRTPRSG